MCPMLCNLLSQGWYCQHENIVLVLGKIKYAAVIHTIFQTIGKFSPTCNIMSATR